MVEEDQVRESLCKLPIYKSMAPDGIQPYVLRKLSPVIVRPLEIIFDQSWHLGEVPKDGSTQMSFPSSRRARRRTRELQVDTSHPVLWKQDGAANPGNHF